MPFSILDRSDVNNMLTDWHRAIRVLPERANLPKPCEIKILMVLDASLGFDNRDFSIKELINVLTSSMGPHARPVITKAHRDSFPVPGDIIPGVLACNDSIDMIDYRNFKFDQHDLSQYDQVWLFGGHTLDDSQSTSTAPNALSDDELEALARFMNGGGGVFATGDHEDIGDAMCGRIPRVRNMRKWYHDKNNKDLTKASSGNYFDVDPQDPKRFPDPSDPDHRAMAPHVQGKYRHDTLTRRDSTNIAFQNQSDDRAQTINPKIYRRKGVLNLVPATADTVPYMMNNEARHRVLCRSSGTVINKTNQRDDGIITKMPDHPHEGECYVPKKLDEVLKFNNYSFEEYPKLGNGSHLKPKIILEIDQQGRAGTQDFKRQLEARKFGGIGVYDGHQVNVGRVLVDSTWHHFINLNLIGTKQYNVFPEDARSQYFDKGFLGSEIGKASYEEIKAYFVNIAIYLARKSNQTKMRFLAALWIRWNPNIVSHFFSPALYSISVERLIQIGSMTNQFYKTFSSYSQSMLWANRWLYGDDSTEPEPEGSLLFNVPEEMPANDTPAEKDRVNNLNREALEYEVSLAKIIHGAAIYEMQKIIPDILNNSMLEEADIIALERYIRRNTLRLVKDHLVDLAAREYKRRNPGATTSPSPNPNGRIEKINKHVKGIPIPQ
ncbi:MAG: hypothetical protein AAF418_01780 [Pseudomonadota bacterium]